jgi:SNF2 family DNA or RNA helicase
MKLPKDFKFITKPYPFQQEAFLFGVTIPNAGILLPPGAGKTKVAIDISRYRLQQNQVKRILIVCPATILYNWKNEIALHSEYKALVVAGGKETRLANIKNQKYSFFITNYEALFPLLRDLQILAKVKTSKGTEILYIDNLDRKLFDMVVFDESARYLKSPGSERTTASIVLADKAEHKLILTGTPIANKPLEIWPQFRALDGGKTFGNNFYRFRNYFFYSERNDPFHRFYLKKNLAKQLTNGIYSICIRKQKEEILPELPEKVFTVTTIEPTNELLESYNTVKKHILGEIDTKQGNMAFNINNILTKMLRLQQITSGFITLNNKTTELRSTPKLDALSDEIATIVDADEAVIVWCRFLKSIDMISARLKTMGIPHITMSGADHNKKLRYDKWKSFQKSKDIPVFIGQVESGGIGIELFKIDGTSSKSQHMIFYENTWALDTREQAIERIHRIGQRSTCRYIDLVVEETIDEKILDTIRQNKQIADLILEEGVAKFLK